MAIRTSTLRPGLLVSLKSSIRGNVTYTKRIIEQEKRDKKTGESKLRWETVRTITDPKEHEAAVLARTAARVKVYTVCSASAFGLLCPDNKEEALEKAIVEARKIAEDFNSKAKHSRLSVYVMTGRIAPDDVEAVRAINSEVRELLKDMQEGIKNLDVKSIREAANKARNLGAMLTPDAEKRIKSAIEAARGVARDIVKAGETASVEIDKAVVKKITDARTAFLDLDGEETKVKVSAAKGVAIDFAPEGEKPVKKSRSKSKAPELDAAL